MKKILSIIIPTYNMEQYLAHCLNSLLIIEKLDMLDVWIVNDGSKDSSSLIAHQYADKYPETFHVIDKPNGNYGSCINTALPRCVGKYIKILDPDDSFDIKSLNKVLEVMSIIDVDLFLTDYCVVDERGIVKQNSHSILPQSSILNFTDVYNAKYWRNFQMHSVAYKRENLLAMNYRQTEGIFYTDQEWIFAPMITVDTIYYLPISLYRYLLGRDGQTMDKNVMLRNLKSLFTVFDSLLDSYNGYSGMDYKKEFLEDSLVGKLKYIYSNALLLKLYPHKEFLLFDEKIRRKSLTIYQRTNRLKANKYLPISYVKLWREESFFFLSVTRCVWRLVSFVIRTKRRIIK